MSGPFSLGNNRPTEERVFLRLHHGPTLDVYNVVVRPPPGSNREVLHFCIRQDYHQDRAAGADLHRISQDITCLQSQSGDIKTLFLSSLTRLRVKDAILAQTQKTNWATRERGADVYSDFSGGRESVVGIESG